MMRKMAAPLATKNSSMVFYETLNAFYDLRSMKFLEAFAGDGYLMMDAYRKYVNPYLLECWELLPECEASLRCRANQVRIGCSYFFLEQALQREDQFDLISIDTPQGIHTDYRGVPRVEHFDFFRKCLPLLGSKGLIIVYVNKLPYDRSKEDDGRGMPTFRWSDWVLGREEFYGCLEVNEEQAVMAYRHHLGEAGLELKRFLLTPNMSDVPSKQPYSFRLALEVAR